LWKARRRAHLPPAETIREYSKPTHGISGQRQLSGGGAARIGSAAACSARRLIAPNKSI